jgi:transposase
MSTSKHIDFTGQDFFVGLDVHARQWRVTIRHDGMELKAFSMDPSPSVLARHMHQHYPGGCYHSVYEAGFCGFWIHRELTRLGFDNIVVHPADVPTSHKEKDRKTDLVDSRKLARELESRKLKGIYVLDQFHEQLRSLVRLRGKITANSTRVKNRIKGYLYLNGIPILPRSECTHWSNRFIGWLESLELATPAGTGYLRLCIEELRYHRQQMTGVTTSLRTLTRSSDIKHIMRLLRSVPGIGFVTAITYYAELVDMDRFSRGDRLAGFVGLVPSVSSSGTTEHVRGLTRRRNRYLRYLIIEAAWAAIRKDEALLYSFNQLTKRMKKQEAIIRIARKLLNRLRSVWRKGVPYCPGVVA